MCVPVACVGVGGGQRFSCPACGAQGGQPGGPRAGWVGVGVCVCVSPFPLVCPLHAKIHQGQNKSRNTPPGFCLPSASLGPSGLLGRERRCCGRDDPPPAQRPPGAPGRAAEGAWPMGVGGAKGRGQLKGRGLCVKSGRRVPRCRCRRRRR